MKTNTRTWMLLLALSTGLGLGACEAELDEPLSDAEAVGAELEAAEEDLAACVAELGQIEECPDEYENLVDALAGVESEGFRAIAKARCGPNQFVVCTGTGACSSTDYVGCTCANKYGGVIDDKECGIDPHLSWWDIIFDNMN